MKITGIIAEFNPFHNGHEYILSQAREKTGCDLVVAAMSGDFVQRGAPAIIDKAVRTKAALLGGADLVLQLPVIASTASAADFALGGVAALAACGVDTLVFGCEQEDFSIFPVLADFLSREPAEYQALLSGYLKDGCSYPLARSRALKHFFPEQEGLSELLASPNNILALEYLRAIKRLGISMQVCPVKRVAVGHHSKDGVGRFASATAIRNELLGRQPAEAAVGQFIPDYSARLLSEYRHLPLCEDDFSAALCYRLVQMKCQAESGPDGIYSSGTESFGLPVTNYAGRSFSYLDGSPDLYDRIFNRLEEFTCLSEFCDLLHTKDCTLSRLKRLMVHILLDLTEDQMHLFREHPCSYVRVLGFRRDSSAISIVKQHAEAKGIPVILSVADTRDTLSNAKSKSGAETDSFRTSALADLFFTQDLFARELYVRTLAQKEHASKKAACQPLLNDYRQPLIVI